MGAKVSTLVFRPPKTTQMSEENYFYIDVDVVTPLTVPGVEGGPCGVGCMPSPDSDLASLDSSFLSEELSTHRRLRHVRNGVQYKIPAFYIRRRNATQTILFSHGNAEDLGMMFDRMKELAKKLSVNILAYDYTGYGMSLPKSEKPSENMLYRNIDAAYEYLTQVRKTPPSSIILYGRSLGGGPACYLAAKTAMQGQSVGGLILHSAFLSVYKVVTDMNGLDMRLVGDMFNNEKRARNIRCPTIIIHGKRDVVVPFWHAPRLLSAIPPEFRWKPMYVEDLGHNSIEAKRRMVYINALTNFINGIRIMKEMNAPIHRDFRASAEDARDNVNFYVNTMWLKHAKMVLSGTFGGKSSNKPVTSGSSQKSGGSSMDKSSFSGSSELGSVDFKRGRTFDPSTISKNNISAKTRTRSFSGRAGIEEGQGLSDARDEEDEFAPWREEREESTPSRTRQEKSSERARHSSSTPSRRTPTKSETTPSRRTPARQSTPRSQSAINKAEYSTKQLKHQNDITQQYGRKSNSMQLMALSKNDKRGRSRNKGDSMYEM